MKVEYSSKNDLLGLLLPTCYPTRAMKNFFKVSSVKELAKISKFCTLLINFQPSWSEDTIDKVLKRLDRYGVKYKYSFNTYTILERGHIPFNLIRNTCAKLMTCKYYMLVDDDFILEKGERSSTDQIIDSLYYMETHPKCGIVSHVKTFRKRLVKKLGKPEKNVITPVPLDTFINTNRGMIIRNIEGRSNLVDKGGIYPKGAEDLVGCGEELLIVGLQNLHGNYAAMLSRARTNNFLSGSDHTGWESTSITNNNVFKFIKTVYKNPTYINQHQIIRTPYYEKAGGSKITDAFIRNNKMDFSEFDVESEKEELLSIRS